MQQKALFTAIDKTMNCFAFICFYHIIAAIVTDAGPNCSEPAPVGNAYRSWDGGVPNGYVNYTCLGPYYVLTAGNLSRRCDQESTSSNYVYTGTPPVCTLTCGVPRPESGSNITSVNNTSLGLATYLCTPPYVGAGDPDIMCSDRKGGWKVSTLDCEYKLQEPYNLFGTTDTPNTGTFQDRIYSTFYRDLENASFTWSIDSSSFYPGPRDSSSSWTIDSSSVYPRPEEPSSSWTIDSSSVYPRPEEPSSSWTIDSSSVYPRPEDPSSSWTIDSSSVYPRPEEPSSSWTIDSSSVYPRPEDPSSSWTIDSSSVYPRPEDPSSSWTIDSSSVYPRPEEPSSSWTIDSSSVYPRPEDPSSSWTIDSSSLYLGPEEPSSSWTIDSSSVYPRPEEPSSSWTIDSNSLYPFPKYNSSIWNLVSTSQNMISSQGLIVSSTSSYFGSSNDEEILVKLTNKSTTWEMNINTTEQRVEVVSVNITLNINQSEPFLPCRTTTAGEEYSGTLNRTSNDFYCLRWDSVTYNYTSDSFPADGNVTAAENYCRQPRGFNRSNGKPWCFTKGNQMNVCDVQACGRIRVRVKDLTLRRKFVCDSEIPLLDNHQVSTINIKCFNSLAYRIPFGHILRITFLLAEGAERAITLNIYKVSASGRPYIGGCGQAKTFWGLNCVFSNVSIAIYQCQEGWHYRGGNLIAICNDFREWVGPDPSQCTDEINMAEGSMANGTLNLSVGELVTNCLELSANNTGLNVTLKEPIEIAEVIVTTKTAENYEESISFNVDTYLEPDGSRKSCSRIQSRTNGTGNSTCSLRPVAQKIRIWSVAPLEFVKICDIKVFGRSNKTAFPLECFQTPKGNDYKGKINMTTSGKMCQNWASHRYTNVSVFPDESQDSLGNNCRNPSNETYQRPWCFISNSSAEWEYCPIFNCDDICRLREDGVNYRGKINTTSSGRTCLNWFIEADTAQQFPFLQNSYFSDFQAPGNKCRNPIASQSRPWCYINQTSREYQFCDIPECPRVGEPQSFWLDPNNSTSLPSWLFTKKIRECFFYSSSLNYVERKTTINDTLSTACVSVANNFVLFCDFVDSGRTEWIYFRFNCSYAATTTTPTPTTTTTKSSQGQTTEIPTTTTPESSEGQTSPTPTTTTPESSEGQITPTPTTTTPESSEGQITPTPTMTTPESNEGQTSPTPTTTTPESSEGQITPTPTTTTPESSEGQITPTPTMTTPESSEGQITPTPTTTTPESSEGQITPTPTTPKSSEALTTSMHTTDITSVTTADLRTEPRPFTASMGSCSCRCLKISGNTRRDLNVTLQQIRQELLVDTKSLSATIRKKVSAKDSRPSAITTGFLGIVFLVVVLTLLVSGDVISVLSFLVRLFRAHVSSARIPKLK